MTSARSANADRVSSGDCDSGESESKVGDTTFSQSFASSAVNWICDLVIEYSTRASCCSSSVLTSRAAGVSDASWRTLSRKSKYSELKVSKVVSGVRDDASLSAVSGV